MKWYPNATEAWRSLLHQVMDSSQVVDVRGGQRTREILAGAACFDMRFPVVDCPSRKLSWRFLGGEALWILRGDDRVTGIAPYNGNISQFSDDGVTFFGAYGPRFAAQVHYVIQTLAQDPSSRQAVMTFWQEPGVRDYLHLHGRPSKDVPCTLTLTFLIRSGRLQTFVTMRSSDLWWGWPYDVFNFTMISARIAAQLPVETVRGLGNLTWQGVSTHLYERHWRQAQETLNAFETQHCRHQPMPDRIGWTALEGELIRVREGQPPGWL